MQVGITERGDAALDTSWDTWVYLLLLEEIMSA